MQSPMQSLVETMLHTWWDVSMSPREATTMLGCVAQLGYEGAYPLPPSLLTLRAPSGTIYCWHPHREYISVHTPRGEPFMFLPNARRTDRTRRLNEDQARRLIESIIRGRRQREDDTRETQ